MPGSELFGAEPSPPPTVRLEKRSSILRSPSLIAGFARRGEDHGPVPVGGRNQEQASTSPRARDRSLRIAMPTTPAIPYTLSQSRSPGWDSPWVAKPFESLSRRNISETLQNGGTPDDQSPNGGYGYDPNDSWWPRTRKRARTYLLNNTYVPLVKHASVEWNSRVPADSLLAVSVHQYHVHRGGPWGGDSYTKSRETDQFYRNPGQLTVRHFTFVAVCARVLNTRAST